MSTDSKRPSTALESALAGALFVGTATALIAGFAIQPERGLPFDFATFLLFGLLGSVFGIIAGAVAGASEDAPTASQVAATQPTPAATRLRQPV